MARWYRGGGCEVSAVKYANNASCKIDDEESEWQRKKRASKVLRFLESTQVSLRGSYETESQELPYRSAFDPPRRSFRGLFPFGEGVAGLGAGTWTSNGPNARTDAW